MTNDLPRGFAQPITPSYHDVVRALALLTGHSEETIDRELREALHRMYRNDKFAKEMGLAPQFEEASAIRRELLRSVGVRQEED